MSGTPRSVPTTRPSPDVVSAADDVHAMRRLVLGDADALGLLMRKHWAPLIRYVTRLVGSGDAAEDIAQDTFVALWQQRAKWQAIAPPRVYIYRIGRNLALKEVRRRTVRERWTTMLGSVRRAVPTPLDDAQRAEVRAAFEAALQQLPPRRREAFVLVRYQGMSLRDAAEIMEISVQTVANHVTAALADLRPLLDMHAEE